MLFTICCPTVHDVLMADLASFRPSCTSRLSPIFHTHILSPALPICSFLVNFHHISAFCRTHPASPSLTPLYINILSPHYLFRPPLHHSHPYHFPSYHPACLSHYIFVLHNLSPALTPHLSSTLHAFLVDYSYSISSSKSHKVIHVNSYPHFHVLVF